ncbi:hypothetical protein TNCV_1587701 [Trichonephila clavipes]|uniref:Uncharacterized protein n=1 Tax=Trichonephila clavipes TaxID=2585209 RepID=A0A8X6REL5_TRICX|nr:hypothetical protein TNCV_1587701 [Trichonephila clavipes]
MSKDVDATAKYCDVPPLGSLLGNEVADDLAKAATSNPVDPEDHMVLTSTEIYSRAKELICRTWTNKKTPHEGITVGNRLTNTFTKDFCVRITNTFKKDFFVCLDNEHILGGDQGDIPEIMDEILTTARDLELEVNEDDIEELIMGHEDELTIEELQEILNEEHQET